MANAIEKTAVVLAGAGAVNWGIVTFANGFNVVSWLAGLPVLNAVPMLANIVYGAVAVSGAWLLWNTFK